LSANADEATDFELGKKAFNNGQYLQALDYFNLSMESGNKTISLTYNIAVTYYKLEQYEESQKYFNKIINNKKMTALVEYNLGLIELKLNNEVNAITLFKKVHKKTKNSKLKSLAKKQLHQLDIKISEKTNRRLKSRVAVIAGHTDNVSNISTGTASGKADNFKLVAAKIEGAFSNSFDQGISAKIRYFSQRYSVEKQFDFNEVEGKISYNFIIGTYKNNISLFTKQSELSQKPYQTISGVEGKFKNNLSTKDYLTFRFRYDDISDDSQIYTYLAGSRVRARVDYQLISKNMLNRFWYQFESNDRDDELIKYSYSPQRHLFRYKYQLRFSTHWKLRAAVEYRKSFYPDKPTIKREDDRYRFITTLEYKFNKAWDIQGVYEYRDNQSTSIRYAYKRNVSLVNLNWRY
jgi:tetratricopeptide (TPR) repeat protein